MVVSVFFVVFLFFRAGRSVPRKRALNYSLLVILLGVIVTGEYSAGDLSAGSVEISAWFLYITLFIAASVQLWALDHRPGYGTLMRSYVIGTFALVLSNFFRIFSGVMNISTQIIGAAGTMDPVFLAGPYLALFYMIATLAFFAMLEIKERLSRRKTM